VIRRIVTFSLTHRFFVLAVSLLGTGLGAVSLSNIPADVLPDLNAPVVLVFVENPGLAPQEMEALIARPLEAAVRGLPGMEVVRSQSSQGLTSVIVQFAWGSDFYRILQQVGTAAAQAQAAFPPGTRPPVLSSATSRLNQVLEIYLSGDLPPRDLRDLADYDVRFALLGVPGVQRVITMGGEMREYDVAIRLDALAAYGVSPGDIERALVRSNLNFAGGFLVTGPQELTIRGLGRLRTLADLEEVRVATVGRRPVLLRHVADIQEASAIRRSSATIGGRVAVTGTVTKQLGTDTRPIIAAVERTLASLRPQLPAGVTLRTFYSQSQLIDVSLANLREALLIGAAAVLLVIWLLVREWVLTLVIAAIMPLSVIMTFAVMRAAGVGLNTMSLGGIAVGLGIMIDAAIIGTENIFRHLHQARGGPIEATLKGALEVLRPVTVATLIILGVFIPVFFLGGIAGRLFAPFAFTVVVTIALGYLLSLTVTPALSYTFLPSRATRAAHGSAILGFVQRHYQRLVAAAIRRPGRTVGFALLVVGATMLAGRWVGFDFLPSWDEGALLVKVQTPPGTSLGLTDLQARRAATIISRGPDVQEVVVRAGRPEGSEEIEGVNNSEIWVRLVPFGRRRASIEDVRDWMRDSLAAIVGARVIVTAPLVERIEESLGGSTAPLAIRIVGDNLDTLAAAQERLARIMAAVPGVVDVNPEAATGITQIALDVDRARAARYGLDPQDVADAVEVAYAGRMVTSILRGQRKEYGVFLRLRSEDRATVEELGRLPVSVAGGEHVRLDQVANLMLTRGPAVIRRDNGERRLQVTANLAGTDLATAVERVRSRLGDLRLPSGYRVAFGGSYENQQQVQRGIAVAVLASVVIIFLILQSAFGSVRQAALMLLAVPLALCGGIGALFVSGITLNVSSLVGLLALFGLSIQTAVLLMQYANDARNGGLSPEAAARAAAEVRLRPVLMTAASASLAVLPLAVGIGAGAELQRPMAVVLVGGLITSTLLTLVLLPALYRFTIEPTPRTAVAA
jgi:cobalt-zinc-cadmium resistance protein CzcA